MPGCRSDELERLLRFRVGASREDSERHALAITRVAKVWPRQIEGEAEFQILEVGSTGKQFCLYAWTATLRFHRGVLWVRRYLCEEFGYLEYKPAACYDGVWGCPSECSRQT